jgi:hypothetical protein
LGLGAGLVAIGRLGICRGATVRGTAIGRGAILGCIAGAILGADIGRAGIAGLGAAIGRGAIAGRAAGAARRTLGCALTGSVAGIMVAAPINSAAPPARNPFIELSPTPSKRRPLWGCDRCNAREFNSFAHPLSARAKRQSISSHPVHRVFIDPARRDTAAAS